MCILVDCPRLEGCSVGSDCVTLCLGGYEREGVDNDRDETAAEQKKTAKKKKKKGKNCDLSA